VKPFREFEREVVKICLASHLPIDEVEAVIDSAVWVSYNYTGCGYYLTVRHPSFPSARVVCDMPLTGTSGNIVCGFVIFLENGELTLECHTWGPEDVPEDFRERQVEIRRGARRLFP
jgi:hypothetical protein